jgi:predicted O-linked N-acetylglucosamine transferase (SPINDLY family)
MSATLAPYAPAQATPTETSHASARVRYGHHQWQRGLDCMRQRRYADARRAFDRAVRAAPLDAVYWINLATACSRSGDLEGSLRASGRATELDPSLALAWILRADALRHNHRYAEALRAYEHAEHAGHMDAEALLHHAQMLQALRQPVAAIDKLLKATIIRPDYTMAHGMMASVFREMSLVVEALECLKTVQALAPNNLQARVHESFEKRHLVRWDGRDEDLRTIGAMLDATTHEAPQAAMTFALLSLPVAPEQVQKAARLDASLYARGVVPLAPVDARTRIGQPLRIGYLSSDFRSHPVSQLLVEVLERRRRSGVEVTLYSHSFDDGSEMRQRLMATADHFVEVNGLSDRAAAERIRADRIDLLVDLQGHTRGQRLAILAHRPAPVQASYLGYAGTTGADFIDYVVGDPFVTPAALAELYTEKLAQLPQCFQPNGTWRPMPQPMTRAQAGLPEDAFVMCAFNHTYKIGPECFDAWCEVLREEPRAVLWLKETNGQLKPQVLAEAARRGVAPERIVFARNVAFAEHFSRLALADVFVDTWPYNAHTTASDALWAGVPVVTLYQNSYASRVAASVLNAAGLPELAFEAVADYVLAIRTLANDGALLAELRRHLEAGRLNSPLFDAERRADELEALYRRMIERSRAGLAADHLLA